MPPSARRRPRLLLLLLALSAATRGAHAIQPTALDPGSLLPVALPLPLQPGQGPGVAGLQGSPFGSITQPVDKDPASSSPVAPVVPPPAVGRPIEPFRYQSPDLLSLYPEKTPYWKDPRSLCRVSVLTGELNPRADCSRVFFRM